MIAKAMKSPKHRVAACDCPRLAARLDEQGYALSAPLLSPAECDELISLYSDSRAFRGALAMEQHNIGRGDHQSFALLLTPTLAELRDSFYPALYRVANRCMVRMNQPERFP